MADRYYLSTDQDSHWFIVPTDRRDDWDDWTLFPPDDERAWTPPTWVIPVGGSPSTVTFTDPRL